jgi:hypothetical protein
MKKSGSVRQYAAAKKVDWRTVYNRIKAGTFNKGDSTATVITEQREVIRIEWEE